MIFQSLMQPKVINFFLQFSKELSNIVVDATQNVYICMLWHLNANKNVPQCRISICAWLTSLQSGADELILQYTHKVNFTKATLRDEKPPCFLNK